MIKILCLDQATKISGYSIFEDKKLLTYGKLEVNNKNSTERMKLMNDKIIELIKIISPDFIVIEDTQQQNNPAVFKQLSQFQGILMAYFFQIDIGFCIVKPSEWKSCCGIKGRKREEQKLNTQLFVKNTYGFDCSEDEADSIGIGFWAVSTIQVNKR